MILKFYINNAIRKRNTKLDGAWSVL